jgi:hypothetical protein
MLIILLIIVFLIPNIAVADVIWPGFMLAYRMIFWALPAGIAIEVAIVKRWFQLNWGRAFWIVTISNIISTIIGALGAAFGGILWELSLGQVINKVLQWGTFNPITWLATLLIATCISYFAELLVLKKIFKLEFNRKRKWAFFVANLLSTLIALVSFYINPWIF